MAHGEKTLNLLCNLCGGLRPITNEPICGSFKEVWEEEEEAENGMFVFLNVLCSFTKFDYPQWWMNASLFIIAQEI